RSVELKNQNAYARERERASNREREGEVRCGSRSASLAATVAENLTAERERCGGEAGVRQNSVVMVRFRNGGDGNLSFSFDLFLFILFWCLWVV
ncbi:hypothetical protein A2U01_0025905, partial [Trifolium medium]|nr:hypothetical protein [Trifolium medium]